MTLLFAEACIRLLGLDPDAAAVRPTAAGIPKMLPWSRSFDGTVDGQAFVEVRRNHLGLRDWDHPPSEAVRVLGVGDSFTYGFGVELEETYLSVAERSLWDRAPATEIGVHKLGMNGTSQYAQLAVLPEYLSSVEPQVVVLGFSEDTDIDENLVQDPLLKEILQGKRRFVVSKEAARDTLHRWSALARFFRARRLRDGAARDVTAFTKAVEAWEGTPHQFDDLVRSGWQRRFIDSFGSRLDDEWQVTENLLDRTRTLVESRGARLVILRVASRYAVEPSAWNRAVENVCGHDPATVASVCGTLDPEHTAKRLRNYAERHELLYVDPGPALREAVAAGESVYFPPPEIHWTRAGHETVGIELSNALGRELSLPERPPALPKKPRHFAVTWAPEPGFEAWASSWIPELRGNEPAMLAQTLLWTDEARVDWMFMPILFDGREWTMSAEARAVVKRLSEQRGFGMALSRVAFAVHFAEGSPHVLERQALDAFLDREVARLGKDYASACGRPLLLVDGTTQMADDRFTVIRVDAPLHADSGCGEQDTAPKGDATCAETSSVLRACVADMSGGKGFSGDPDVVLVTGSAGEGFENVLPKEATRRLTTSLVADVIGRWKRGEPGERSPGPRSLRAYQSWLRPETSGTDAVTISVDSPRFSCSGCYEVEPTKDGPFAWTGETAEMVLRGFSPNSRCTVALDVLAPGIGPNITFEAQGTRAEVALRTGPVPWPNPVLVERDGSVRFKIRVHPFRPKGPKGDDTGQRVLGVGVKAVQVSEQR